MAKWPNTCRSSDAPRAKSTCITIGVGQRSNANGIHVVHNPTKRVRVASSMAVSAGQLGNQQSMMASVLDCFGQRPPPRTGATHVCGSCLKNRFRKACWTSAICSMVFCACFSFFTFSYIIIPAC